MRKAVIIVVVAILVLAIFGVTLHYLYSESGSQADIKFIDISLEASDPQTFFRDLSTYKKFKFVFTYETLGGFVPVTCKNFTLNVHIEDVDVGSIKLDDLEISGDWSRNNETVLLDVSSLPSQDLQYIQNKFYDYKNELKVDVAGSATIDAVATTKTVNRSLTKYFLLGTPSINLVDVYWGRTSAMVGESVPFHVKLSSVYRGSQTSGALTVIVIEDIALAPDRDINTYSFSVSLDSGQSSKYSDSFTIYKYVNTRGFFLKVYWEGTQIFEMGEGYPPRLKAA